MIQADFAAAERFRGWIARHLGLHFDEGKLPHLAALVAERAASRGVSAADYLDSLGAAAATKEWRPLVAALTVAETYFFRHVDQFKAFREVALPQALTAAGSAGKVRILCAGCASGEEPYSLCIWMREHGIERERIAPICAVDVNTAKLQKAVAARYSRWALRETPASTRERWFESDGRDYVVAASIRTAVQFEELNLAEPNPGWWSRGSFDVIFCRNVLMYFTREAAVRAVARLAGALDPGGYLFMGHAETLRELSDDFELCHSHGTFYYRRREKAQEPAPAATVEPAIWPQARAADTPYVADRMHCSPPPAKLQVELPKRSPDTALRIQNAWRLLAEERFGDAIDALEPIADEVVGTDLRLMLAALKTHAGRLPEAEGECVALLRRNAHDAGAHYLLALCRDGAHDRRGAIEHNREAVSLAPQFSLPPLHLGLMARRAGDFEDAARYFATARQLLQNEDAQRLLLFGGGFSRAALMSLCGEAPSRSRRKAAR